MSTVQSAIKDSKASVGTSGSAPIATLDKAEEMLRTADETTKESTGISLLHILTLASIGASVALFFSGKKQAGIFVGLWPPTFQALKAAVDNNNKGRSR